MNKEDIEKAWQLLSMHNSELLIENADLRKRLELKESIRHILWMRIARFFRRGS